MKSQKRITQLRAWSFATFLAPLAGLFGWAIGVSPLDVLGCLLYLGMPIVSLALSFLLRDHRETMNKAYVYVYTGLAIFFCLIFYGVPLSEFFRNKLKHTSASLLLSVALCVLLAYVLSRAQLGSLRKVFTAPDLNTSLTPSKEQVVAVPQDVSPSVSEEESSLNKIFAEEFPSEQPTRPLKEDASSPPLHPAWFMTAERYYGRAKTQTKKPMVQKNLRDGCAPSSPMTSFLQNITYQEQLEFIYKEISQFNKTILPQQLKEIKKKILSFEDTSVPISSCVHMAGVPIVIDQLCALAEMKADAFSLRHISTLHSHYDSKTQADAWEALGLQLKDSLTHIRKTMDLLCAISVSYTKLTRATKQADAEDNKNLVSQLHERALLLASQVNLTLNVLPCCNSSQESKEPATLITLNTPFPKWGVETEADAYAKEVLFELKRDRGIAENESLFGSIHGVEGAKKRYLKEYYNIDWLTSSERNPGWIFD